MPYSPDAAAEPRKGTAWECLVPTRADRSDAPEYWPRHGDRVASHVELSLLARGWEPRCDLRSAAAVLASPAGLGAPGLEAVHSDPVSSGRHRRFNSDPAVG